MKNKTKKVVFTNKLDINIFDTDFYLSLLENIKKLMEQNEQKK